MRARRKCNKKGQGRKKRKSFLRNLRFHQIDMPSIELHDFKIKPMPRGMLSDLIIIDEAEYFTEPFGSFCGTETHASPSS